MTIQEAIKERHMVRKYLEKPIPTEIAAQLQERLTEGSPLRSPSGGRRRDWS